MQDLLNSLQASFFNVIDTIVSYLPQLIAAIVLLIVGWLLGKLLGSIVTKVLRAVRFNELAGRAEIDKFLQMSGVGMGPSAMVGALARWTVYIFFFLAAMGTLGLPQVSSLLNSIIGYIPAVVVAVIVLVIGALVGKLLANIVRGSVGVMGIGSPGLFANVARFAVIAFAVIAALDILGIAPNVVNGLWYAFLALIVGSLVLALGLGGRQAASDLILGRMLRGEVEPGLEVQTDSYRGKVLTVGSLYTTIETPEGIVKLPNHEITGHRLQMQQQQYQQQQEKKECKRSVPC